MLQQDGNTQVKYLIDSGFGFVWIDSLCPCSQQLSGRSVHLTTLFSWASLTKQLSSTSRTFFHLQLTTTLLESAEERRMTVEIVS